MTKDVEDLLNNRVRKVSKPGKQWPLLRRQYGTNLTIMVVLRNAHVEHCYTCSLGRAGRGGEPGGLGGERQGGSSGSSHLEKHEILKLFNTHHKNFIIVHTKSHC